MPEKRIECAGCQLFLGTIQKASLRKNISFLCEKCENKRYDNTSSNKSYDSDNLFDDFNDSIFGKYK